jgi:epsin
MWDRIGSLRRPASQLDADLKEATSDKNYGIANTKLQGIALQSTDQADCQVIIGHVWNVLQEKSDKKWRCVQKCLTLVEVLLKHGSDMIIQEIRRDLWRIQHWKEHRVSEGGKEVGGGIRAKAELIVALCSDEDTLRQEREKAMALSAKMTGMGTNTTQQGGRDQPSGVFKSPFEKSSAKKKGQTGKMGSPDGSPNSTGSSPPAPWGAGGGGFDSGYSGGYGGTRNRREPSDHEKSQMVTTFMGITGAPRQVAQQALERADFDLQSACNRYMDETGVGLSSGGGTSIQ